MAFRMGIFREKWEEMQKWDIEFVQSIKFGLFIMIGVAIFGFFWWLKLPKMGFALLISCIFLLIPFLILERRLIQKMDDDAFKEEKAEKEDEPKQDHDDGFGLGEIDFGLPSSDEYNQRMKKAFGEGFEF